MTTDADELMTVPEVAMRLRVSGPTVRRLIAEGHLDAVQVAPGHAIRIRRSELYRILAAEPTKTAAA